MSEREASALGLLVELLAAELAPRVADELERRGLVTVGPASNGSAAALVPLERFAESLPATAGRNWTRWLRERARLGEIPPEVAVKAGGRWWFRPVEAREWAAEGFPAPAREEARP